MALQITTQQPACAFIPCGGGLRSIQSQPILVNLLSESTRGHILRTPSSSMLMSSVLLPEMHSVDEKVEHTGFDARKSLASTLNVEKNNVGKIKKFPTVIGHRGSLYKSLENTRHSFLTAANDGAHGVELDVFLLKCGSLVVFHGTGTDEVPGHLQDYCNIDGSILDYTAEEARQFKFNHLFEEFPDSTNIIKKGNEYYIPLLEDVLLDAKVTGVTVKIELKGPNTPDPVLELVDRLGMVDQCHYSSFDHSKIKRIRELRPEKNHNGSHRYRTGALFNEVPDNFIELAKEVDASEIHLRYDTCTSDRVRAIHDADLDSMCWMRGPRGMKSDLQHRFHDVWSEDEKMYRTIMSSGVKGMCVNKPWLLSGMLKPLQ